MRKFAITITKTSRKVVKTFEKQEDAMKYGNEVAGKTTSAEGTVSCISADFDEEDNMIGNQYRLFHTWI